MALLLPALSLGVARRGAPGSAAAAASRSRTAALARSSDCTVDIAGAKRELLEAAELGARGVNASEDIRRRVEAAVVELEQAGREQCTTDASLSATWRMVWTSEKETLFILKNAPVFGSQAGLVFQVIDVESGSLSNVIEFPPSGGFVVGSSIDVASQQRVNFKFNEASFVVNGRRWAVPPFGQGWFESTYLDDDLRIARDSRGDLLVVAKHPADWTGLGTAG